MTALRELAPALHDRECHIAPLHAAAETDKAALRTGKLISGMIDARRDAPDTLPWD